MSRPRVLMLGFDGFELSIAEPMMAAGRLPALSKLHASSAFLRLDHGSAKRTGLAWEHVASGLHPDDAKRWAAVDFDASNYAVWQQPTALTPFPAALDATRTVMFDAPYFDLGAAPGVQGLVAWGAHDPGIAATARPETLAGEIRRRFGRYPATPYIYGFVWPSAERTAEMADALRRATALRSDIAQWLLTERLPDWELAIVVVSEFHSAIEALWHGVDATHPLHHLPSAAPARRGIEGVYEEADRLLARLQAALPDAQLAVFNLHGMGANNSDVQSMVLLGELLYRHAFGTPLMREQPWRMNGAGVPLIPEGRSWQAAMGIGFGDDPAAAEPSSPSLVQRVLRRLRRTARSSDANDAKLPLAWMPVTRYRPFWPRMRAFALPSFYDGRIRVNLAGREAQGIVPLAQYEATLDEIERLLYECRDALTGEPVVDSIERCAGSDPLALSATESDLVVAWRGAALGFDHPRLGRIGPLPYRRTGGHTGRWGAAWMQSPAIAAADHGIADAFDVVPTVIELLGERRPERLSGASLLTRIAAPKRM